MCIQYECIMHAAWIFFSLDVLFLDNQHIPRMPLERRFTSDACRLSFEDKPLVGDETLKPVFLRRQASIGKFPLDSFVFGFQ